MARPECTRRPERARSQFVAGAGEPRHHLLAGEAQCRSCCLVLRSQDALDDCGTASADQAAAASASTSVRACASTASVCQCAEHRSSPTFYRLSVHWPSAVLQSWNPVDLTAEDLR